MEYRSFGLNIVLRAVLAMVVMAVAVTGSAANPTGRYVGFDDAPFQYVEISGDTLATVAMGHGLMPAIRSAYRMVNTSDSITLLVPIHDTDSREAPGVEIAFPVEPNPEGNRIVTVSEHEILLLPMNLPYVDETWLSQWLLEGGAAVIVNGQPIAKDSTNESLVSSLQEAVKAGDIKVELLHPRDAYRRYGAVGISGALVFLSDCPNLPDF